MTPASIVSAFTTIDLGEYEVVEKELSSDQTLALMGCDLVKIKRAWSPDRFELTASATVGIQRIAPNLAIRVKPKLPVRRLVYLLAHAAGLASWHDDLLELDDDADIDAAAAAAFVFSAERTLRRGVRSSYFTEVADLMELRGRLDTNRQIQRLGIPIPVSVIFDDYGPDIIENQLLAGAADQLLRLSTVPSEVRRRLQVIGASLDGVRLANRDDARKPIHFTRLNEHYRSSVALARMILDGSTFDLLGGHRLATGFAINMFTLFEEFLGVALGEAIEARCAGKLKHHKHDRLDVDHKIQIIPDFTLLLDRAPVAVIDAKYKSLGEDLKPAEADLYQAVSYCVAMGLRNGYLVHATGTKVPNSLVIRSSDISIHVVGLDLGAPIIDLQRQIGELADLILYDV